MVIKKITIFLWLKNDFIFYIIIYVQTLMILTLSESHNVSGNIWSALRVFFKAHHSPLMQVLLVSGPPPPHPPRRKGVDQFVPGDTPETLSETLWSTLLFTTTHPCSYRENRRFDTRVSIIYLLQTSSPLVCFHIFPQQDVLRYRICIHTNLQTDFKLKCI